MSEGPFTVDQLEAMLKEMAREHKGQKDKHIPQFQHDHKQQKVKIAKVLQKRIKKGTVKGS